MKRREFIILSGIGATSASLLSACGHPEEKLIPALIPDDEYVPGIDYWKASTCGMCSAGCGIIVRTREHKANKIEGNPLHPVNRGALCARGQAGLEVLYNPDRIKGPMKRIGERGEGKWEEITWDEAIKTLAEKLREIKLQGDASGIVFATLSSRGVIGIAIDFLSSALDAKFWTTRESSSRELARGYPLSYGRAATPIFDISNATYLLSFGARFLETWHSPVMYSLAFGEFRRSRGKARGKFVQVEPRMSMTGANADEWLPAAVGSEGLIALAIAQVIIREKLIKDATSLKFPIEPLDEYAPEQTATLTGIAAETIVRVAREFAASERPLAIGPGAGSSQELGEMDDVAIHFLNTLSGNINKSGGVLLPASDRFDAFDALPPAEVRGTGWWSINELSIRINNSKPAGLPALLVHQVNPVLVAPRSVEWIEGLPFIASFSSFMDETTQLADLIMPDHTDLERWDLHSMLMAGSTAAVSLVQPVVAPQHNTMQTADVLLAVCRDLEFKEADSEAYQSAEAMVKYAAQRLKSPDHSSDAEGEPLKSFLEAGVCVRDAPRKGFSFEFQPFDFSALLSQTEATNDSYPLTLLCYEHASLGSGDAANLPALQELPDPLTSVVWGSWVEINPKTAASLGVNDGDLVEVATEHGSVRAPAVLYPPIRPEVIAMPYGQGHTSYGRYANGRGPNVFVLNPFGMPGESVRARVTKVGGKAELIRFGTELQERMEKRR
ncbi:MAG: molybdopterin-dependent oxidoreductase [Acidobacteriota bacterium]